jgi:predicted ATPase
MATLESLRLSGWKSIKETDPPITFGKLNVLVGANGSGKSNLVSFFRMLGELAIGRLQQHLAKSGGANTLFHKGIKETHKVEAWLTLQFKNERAAYAFKLETASPADIVRLAESVVRPPQSLDGKGARIFALSGNESYLINPNLRLQPHGEIAPWLAATRTFHFDDTTETAAVRRAGYIDDNRQLRADAGNLSAVLYAYRQTRPPVYRRILGAIRQVAPFVEDFVLGPRRLNPKEIQFDWLAVGSDYLLGPHQLSDGTLRMTALTTLLLQPEEDLPPLIVIDEPELGLHPAAIGILAGMLKQASQHAQVIVATQSATLLNHFDAEDVIVVDSKDGVSSFRRLDPEPYREWIEEYGLSDLWERNVIGGGPY